MTGEIFRSFGSDDMPLSLSVVGLIILGLSLGPSLLPGPLLSSIGLEGIVLGINAVPIGIVSSLESVVTVYGIASDLA
jgi:hypothetical protein